LRRGEEQGARDGDAGLRSFKSNQILSLPSLRTNPIKELSVKYLVILLSSSKQKKERKERSLHSPFLSTPPPPKKIIPKFQILNRKPNRQMQTINHIKKSKVKEVKIAPLSFLSSPVSQLPPFIFLSRSIPLSSHHRFPTVTKRAMNFSWK
jgi:hypothetical protein